ncbi:MAG: hypothetical protein FJ271_08055 [Planctomycetes bacterium]|nr:hypothetical protein [Planctomycetota bacterium]
MRSEQIIIAWAHPSHPHVLFGLAFAAGVCLLYSDNLPTRLGGSLLAFAAALGASGPRGDPDNWFISLIWVGIAALCLVVIRPRWLGKSSPPAESVASDSPSASRGGISG